MTAFVLGNGTSRQEITIDQLLHLGSVYACNGVYRTHTVTALVATDHPISKVIQESGYSKTYYQQHKVDTVCNLCSIPVLERCLAQHQTTLRCLKFRKLGKCLAQ